MRESLRYTDRMEISSAASTLASGLDLQMRRLEASAVNVANVATPGYEPTTVVGQTTPGGGVSPLAVPASIFPMSGLSDAAAIAVSGTDLAFEVVTQITALSAYQAQVNAFRSIDEAERSFIDGLRA